MSPRGFLYIACAMLAMAFLIVNEVDGGRINAWPVHVRLALVGVLLSLVFLGACWIFSEYRR